MKKQDRPSTQLKTRKPFTQERSKFEMTQSQADLLVSQYFTISAASGVRGIVWFRWTRKVDSGSIHWKENFYQNFKTSYNCSGVEQYHNQSKR